MATKERVRRPREQYQERFGKRAYYIHNQTFIEDGEPWVYCNISFRFQRGDTQDMRSVAKWLTHAARWLSQWSH